MGVKSPTTTKLLSSKRKLIDSANTTSRAKAVNKNNIYKTVVASSSGEYSYVSDITEKSRAYGN